MHEIPDVMRRILSSEPYRLDEVGMSDGEVLLFPDKVLKISAVSEESRNEVRSLQWLSGRLPVPEVIAETVAHGKHYLLLSRAPGAMACDAAYLREPERLTALVAAALQALWRVDASGCPMDQTLEKKLQAAEAFVRNGLVDTADAEPETFGPDGFANPEALLEWLRENRPAEEVTLSHGDFCLPNLIVAGDGTVSYIDLGRTGLADKWCDIALCYRSLLHNYSGKYAAEKYPGYSPALLFEKLGLTPDWRKLRYYLLLDELF